MCHLYSVKESSDSQLHRSPSVRVLSAATSTTVCTYMYNIYCTHPPIPRAGYAASTQASLRGGLLRPPSPTPAPTSSPAVNPPPQRWHSSTSSTSTSTHSSLLYLLHLHIHPLIHPLVPIRRRHPPQWSRSRSTLVVANVQAKDVQAKDVRAGGPHEPLTHFHSLKKTNPIYP